MELDPYSEEFFNGAWETYRYLRDEEPVHHNERLNFWALSRYDDVSAALRDWSTFSSAQGTMMDQLDTPGFSAEMMPGWLLVYDPPDHSRLRRLAAAAFSPRSVQDLTTAVDAAVTSAFDSVAGSKEFDLVESVVTRIPAEVMYDLMGIPLQGREHAMTLTDAFLYAGDGTGGDINAARIAAMMELAEFLMSIVREKRVKPGNDIMSRMIEAHFLDDEGKEQRLNDTEMCYYLLLLLAAGTETTAKLTCGAVVGLHSNPDQWKLLLDDPRLVKAAALEAGRHESPVQILGRRCVKETTLHGTTIPAGANVYLLLGSANRDDRVYPNPGSFDLTRSFDPPPVTYGWGPHLCLGKHLALLEVETTLDQLRARWPHFQIDESRLQRVHGFQVFGWSSVPVFV